MNRRLAAVLIFALGVSGAASLLVYKLAAQRIGGEREQAAARVVVAERCLPVGSLIRESDVRLATWTAPVPQQALLKLEDALGRGVVAAIYENEPVLEARLAPRGAGAGLAATIPPGMRAVAVRVNELVGVAGFVVPGMRVDAVIAGNPPRGGQAQGTRSRTILQNIEVLSAGQQIEKDAEGKPVAATVVHLLTTPEQAEQLTLASNEGRIQLVLRNPTDVQEVRTPGSALAQLFGGARPSPMPSAPPPAMAPQRAEPQEPRAGSQKAEAPPVVVEVLHGAARAEVKFHSEEAGKP